MRSLSPYLVTSRALAFYAAAFLLVAACSEGDDSKTRGGQNDVTDASKGEVSDTALDSTSSDTGVANDTSVADTGSSSDTASDTSADSGDPADTVDTTDTQASESAEDVSPEPTVPACSNGRLDLDEDAVDCGGVCLPCGLFEACDEGDCREGLVCNLASNTCRGEPLERCNTTDDCGPNLVCVDGLCTSAEGRDCRTTSCPEGFLCKDLVCKAGSGTACLEGHCAEGLACDRSGLCLPSPGEACEPEVGCANGLTCDPATLLCKVPVGGNCGAASECLEGATCDRGACVPVGGNCNGGACASGYLCLDDACLPGADKPCFAGGVCAPGHACVVDDGVGLCKASPGTPCSGTENCAPGHVCEGTPARCLAIGGEDCEVVPCATGFVCDTDGRCALPGGALGCATDAECVDGSVCQSGQCRMSKGEGCGLAKPCASELVCDEDGICRVPVLGSCEEAIDCTSGLCREGRCAPTSCTEQIAHGERPPCEKSMGLCEGLLKPSVRCLPDGRWEACAEADYRAWAPAYSEVPEHDCDGLDGDCDGRTDEGCVGVSFIGFAAGGTVGERASIFAGQAVGSASADMSSVEWGMCFLGAAE